LRIEQYLKVVKGIFLKLPLGLVQQNLNVMRSLGLKRRFCVYL